MITIAINGFGRIGRNFLRALIYDKQAQQRITIAAINIGPANPIATAHMFKYDSLMGTFPGSVEARQNLLIIDGMEIKIIAECDPTQINWSRHNIDWVVEASGKFTQRAKAQLHLDAGAKYVLITAPAKGEDVSIIPGVNEHQFDPRSHKIVSLGSCTTNAFITLLKILDDAFKIQTGFMTTIHAYTNSQVLLDVENTDLRRSRAAALNIIPTTTGASTMVEKTIPNLKGKIEAIAIRVPIAKVSLIDLSFVSQTTLTQESINQICQKAAETTMKNIVGFSTEPLVSSDYSCSPFSVVIDSLLTKSLHNTGKVFGWYDNEWGYSMRLKDFLVYASQQQ